VYRFAVQSSEHKQPEAEIWVSGSVMCCLLPGLALTGIFTRLGFTVICHSINLTYVAVSVTRTGRKVAQ